MPLRGEAVQPALAKGETRKQMKARADRAFIKARLAARLAVYQREQMRCQRCSIRVRLDVPEWAHNRAHVNETVPRSKGGDPTNPDHCELVCRSCHLPNGQHAPTPERLAILTGQAKGKC